jgi:putative tryptophan/tyrosine transport system substrate-binding protein
VFTTGGDPVELGLVASLNKPGGNVTGVTFLASDVGTKRLGLLRQFAPKTTAIAMLMNVSYAPTAGEVRDVQAAARLGLQINVLYASTSSEIDAAFETFRRGSMRFSSGGTHFYSASVTESCRSRRVTLFPRSIHSVNNRCLKRKQAGL